MTKPLPRSILFITGTFLSHNCWDEWKLYFESKGYKCLAPAWPYKNASTEDLRNWDSGSAIALNGLAALTDHFAAIVKNLPEKPIIIGHSLGGLIVQLLLQRGLGTAGVAIHSFPPRGLGAFRFSFLKTWWETMGFFTSTQKTYLMPFKKWKYAVANEMTDEQQRQLYYQYVLPESKQIIRDAFKRMAKINFSNPHAPLLLTSGSQDKIIPSSLNYYNYLKYKTGKSITDYKDFKDRNHLVFGHPAWTEDADFILYWLQGLN
jgi:pimeloyl-ACP methyl ester carboxylesterase